MKFLSTVRTLALLIALLLLASLSVSAQEEGGILRVGMNAPITLDPALHPNDPETALNRAIYDYLIEVLPDSSIGPNLASDWTISEDGLTYTFTLVDGVTFHDGSPFTSADVVYTFNRLKEVGSPALNLLGSEYEVSAPDEMTVEFTLPAVNADFLYGVGSRWTLIVKDGTTTPNELAEGDNPYANFNGTGPFILESFSPDDRAVLRRNENYWQEGLPLLEGLEFIYMEDPIAQVDALRSGTVDFIFKIPSDQFSSLEGAEGITTLQRPTSQHPVIRVRADEGFVGADPVVREALKYATDRAALNDLLLEGRGIVGHNDPIGPVYEAFYDETIEDQPYDPARACALLSEAGLTDGLNLTLYTPDSLGYPDLATVLQQMWGETGCINIEIEVRPETVYYSSNEWAEVELGITGYGARPIPQQFLVEAYASDGLYNESHWSDEELDALIEQAGQTTDEAARAEIYSQIAQLFRDRGPIIIPWFAPMLGAASSRVQGLEMAPFPGSTDFRQVSIGEM